jgi:hypothetical protein
MSIQRVRLQDFNNCRTEPIETRAHIDRSDRHEDPSAFGELQHGTCSKSLSNPDRLHAPGICTMTDIPLWSITRVIMGSDFSGDDELSGALGNL